MPGRDATETAPTAVGDDERPTTTAAVDSSVDIASPSPDTTEPADMLEAHAPHEPIHTWTSFFIHIATIAIGLLIAVGLERTVDFIHHRQQLREARVELSQELQDNRRVLAINKDFLATLKTQLDVDMVQLRATQASSVPVSPHLVYSWHGLAWPSTGSWQSLRQSGSLTLMSHDELKRYTYVYDGISTFQDAAKELAALIDTAGAIAQRSPDGSVRASDVLDLIAATSQCQGKMIYAATILKIEGLGLDNAPRRAVE